MNLDIFVAVEHIINLNDGKDQGSIIFFTLFRGEPTLLSSVSDADFFVSFTGLIVAKLLTYMFTFSFWISLAFCISNKLSSKADSYLASFSASFWREPQISG